MKNYKEEMRFLTEQTISNKKNQEFENSEIYKSILSAAKDGKFNTDATVDIDTINLLEEANFKIESLYTIPGISNFRIQTSRNSHFDVKISWY